tara:strand:- start:41 stop:442 length:402 start_codon:yes stop_codon:yes gene_type:complete
MSKPIIYTNETCAYCKSVKEELTKKNVEFEERLTSKFTDEYQAIVNMTGIPTVPTVKHDDELYVSGRDFQNIEQLTNLLLDFKKPPYSDSRRALERVKTLNYHMNTAFGRLDQLLRQIENKLNIKEDEHKSTN